MAAAAVPRAPLRVGVVLSGGGLRGAAHVGVLQQLVAHNIPIDVIVGASAGAVVAAYYAAVGVSLEELAADARMFRGRHLLAHSLNIRLHGRFNHILQPRSGVIPQRLTELEAASFHSLHHGISAVGIVCHDLTTRQPRYFTSIEHPDVCLSDIVRASASIPGLFPPIRVECGPQTFQLTDGGVSDCLPVAFAQRAPLSATHVIVSDCRSVAVRDHMRSDSVLFVRPPLFTTGMLRAPSSTLAAVVRQGAAAVTQQVLDRIDEWLDVTEAQPAG